jgi:hypothetical protein
MEGLLDNQLINFKTMHDEYLVVWNEVMASGDDTSSIERLMTEDYYVTFLDVS